MKTLWLKEFRQRCYSRLRPEKWQASAVCVCVYIYIQSPLHRLLSHTQSHRWEINNARVFISFLNYSSYPHPVHSQSPGTLVFLQSPSLCSPRWTQAEVEPAHTSCWTGFLCFPSLSAFSPKPNMIDSFPTMQPGPMHVLPGWWVVGGWLSHGLFALVIYDHPCSHNASTSVRATTP